MFSCISRRCHGNQLEFNIIAGSPSLRVSYVIRDVIPCALSPCRFIHRPAASQSVTSYCHQIITLERQSKWRQRSFCTVLPGPLHVLENVTPAIWTWRRLMHSRCVVLQPSSLSGVVVSSFSPVLCQLTLCRPSARCHGS